ncbi:MAG: hypothetical protein ACJ79H_22140 [Myxococcales bacterium]
MPDNEKGLNRGGALGQEGDLESKDLDQLQTERSGSDRRGQGRVTPERRNAPGEMNQQRGGLRREPDLEGAEKQTGHEVD